MNLRAVPCKTPGCPGPQARVPLPGVAALPTAIMRHAMRARPTPGDPYLMGRAPSRFPFRVYCAACGRETQVTAQDWALARRMTPEDLERLGLLERYTRDLEGYGLPRAQAVDCLRHGWTPEGLSRVLPLSGSRSRSATDS